MADYTLGRSCTYNNCEQSNYGYSIAYQKNSFGYALKKHKVGNYKNSDNIYTRV